MRVPRPALAAAVAATLAALAGCGTVHGLGSPAADATRKATLGAKPAAAAPKPSLVSATAKDVVARAKAALASAKSVHVVGSTAAGSSVQVDIRVKSGSGAAGSITVSGAKIEIVKLGEKMYFHSPATVWIEQGLSADMARLLAGKWVLMSASALGSGGEDLLRMTSTQGLSELLVPDGMPKRPGATWPTATVRGVPTIKLTDDTGSLYVARTGKPYPVRIGDAPALGGGQIDFTEYDKPVTITAPPAAQILTLPNS